MNAGLGLVISLCDRTGYMVAPWVRAGYHAVLVDPQQQDISTPHVTRLSMTVLEAVPELVRLMRCASVKFVMGFPPCTDVAVSGARWFPEKYSRDVAFQAKAALVAEQCRMIGMMSGAPWAFENPVSVLSSIFGKPDHTFDPWQYTGYCEDDNYTKKTCLWSGGGVHYAESLCGCWARTSR